MKYCELTPDELREYFRGLLAIRYEYITGDCPAWRLAKQLYVPQFLQAALAAIGEYVDVTSGRKFIPFYQLVETCRENRTNRTKGEVQFAYDIDAMLKTSDKLAQFRGDGIRLLRDAFPRNREGDKETMTAIIGDDGLLWTVQPFQHEMLVNYAVFLGLGKSSEEASWEAYYSVPYCDASYIKNCLIHDERLI